jgi:L-threonylcarbamoyladenylate synthase
MLLASLGEPISSTSANAPGGEPARSATDVDAALSILGEEANVIILDGGLLPASPPSTIVDCSVSPPRVVRIGAIGTAELTEIVHGLQLPAT